MRHSLVICIAILSGTLALRPSLNFRNLRATDVRPHIRMQVTEGPEDEGLEDEGLEDEGLEDEDEYDEGYEEDYKNFMSEIDPAFVNHRAGFVSIVGSPNVGKSTLLNAIIGEKMAITTSKPSTTRHRILGFLNDDDYQLVFSDTPGVILPQYKLHNPMMNSVKGAISDADTILFMTDVFEKSFPHEQILERLQTTEIPLFVLVNKVDLLAPGSPLSEEKKKKLDSLDQIMERWQRTFPKATIFPISALKENNTDALVEKLVAAMPLHEPYYDKEDLSDKPEKFFVAELLREQLLRHYSQELPYSCEVVVDSFKEEEKIVRIKCFIYVVRDSQKGILIGHKGNALKRVNTKARLEMEDMLQKKVFLETKVKVDKNWRDNLEALKRFGYYEDQ